MSDGPARERRLVDPALAPELPADRPRPSRRTSGWLHVRHTLEGPSAECVRGTAARLAISPGAVFAAAVGLVVARLTGTGSLLLGVPRGRPASEGEAGDALRAGQLVPVRVDLDDDATADAYLHAVQLALAGWCANPARSLPIPADAVAWPRVAFAASASLLPAAAPPGAGPAPAAARPPDVTVLVIADGEGYGVEVGAAEDLWLPAELEGFAEDCRTAVAELAAAAGERLEEVRGIAPARRRLLEELNDTARPLPSTTVDALFREMASRTPDGVAVRAQDGTLTYSELARAAGRQARHLVDAGARAGDLVLVCLERSLAEIVAVLGTLWVGAAYVGVEPGLPGPRLEQILASARSRAGCFRIGRPAGPDLDGVPEVPAWDRTWSGTSTAPPEPAPEDPERIAYVAFTSGSTGEPKGIRIPHRAVVRLASGADYAELGEGERVLRFAPLSFDASTFEIWGALLSGATLEVHPPVLPAPAELGAFLKERGVSVAWLTSGLFSLLVEHAPDSFAGLRHVLTGGDVVSPQHAAHVLARHPGLVVTNGYGPTENTTFTTVHQVRSAADVEDPLPIGRPIANTTVHVLDGRGRLLPPGAVGELYAGGAGLAAGYLGESEDDGSTSRFGRLSPDVAERLYRTGDLVRLDSRGRLRFLGRNDDQVKIRGFRVELEEIRRALLQHGGVREAVVVAIGESADRRLVAACVPAGDGLDPRRLRDHLAARLPEHMVPVLWTVVDELPVTAAGKIDRALLVSRGAPVPAPADAGAADAGAAGSGLHGRIAGIFAEVLGFPMPAGSDDFFALGGDSLRAFRLLGLVEERLGVAAPLRDFLLDPTLAGLVRVVERELGGAQPPS